jgi:beta-glucosidase-like glycosyl hydrolase
MHSASIADGLDQDMPGPASPANATGQDAEVERSCQRILRPLIRMGVLDTPNNGTIDLNVSNAARQATALGAHSLTNEFT